MITRSAELPVRTIPCLPECEADVHAAHCRLRRQLAGHGRSLARDRAPLAAWWAQLRAWDVPYNRPSTEERLWYIIAAPLAGRQCLRVLPSSNREIIVYPPGRRVTRTWAAPSELSTQGPWYVLPFRDARALWADTHVILRPAIDGEWEQDPDPLIGL